MMAFMSVFTLFVICGSMSLTLGQEIALTYNLRENQEVGTFVGNVARESLLYGNISESEFQRLKFTFFTQGNPNAKLFTIDEHSSTIRTAEVVDREAICPLKVDCSVALDIAVYMRESGRNAFNLYKLMKVMVIIDDVNDNAPTFPRARISLTVPESVLSGHVLLTSGAVDADMGHNNSIQSYDLIPSSGMFGLKVVKNWDGSSDLGIVVKHPLDRETRDEFQVKVIAKDGGYPIKTGSVIIDIKVTDVNDNRPVFRNSTYNISVFENIPKNRTVLQLSTVDADEGINGQVKYKYSSRVSDKVRNAFGIEEETGRIYSKGSIDYETTKQYQFMVEAHDGGSPPLSSQALVTIDVEDENDNAPKISINLSPEGTDISEAVDTKKFVAHVSVTDADFGNNKNVRCTMSDTHFALESFFDTSYKIVLGKKLDHETQATHNVTVTCTDQGRIPLSSTESFMVNVLDENDNFPEFSQTMYTGSIIENNDVGEEILRVTAHDWDSGNNGRVRYSIDDEIARYFAVDRDTGIISANAVLDREVNPEFKFNVIATDYGKQPKAQSVGIVITVLDQNDEPPKFTKPVFFCYVMENQNPGASAGNITATDKDEKINGEFLFSMPVNSWARDFFDIHPRTGLVSTKKKFDRETNDQFSFSVNVRDPQVPGFSDTANVTVYILDDNDNVPIILYPTADNNTAEVAFETKVATVIATVQAYDKDEPANAKIIYMLKSGNNRHLFNMNRITGDLALSRTIRPDDSGYYKLDIMVTDSGNPPMAARTKLFIDVAKTNGTYMGFDGEGETDKNMLIVISLVAVTLILGIAIVTTICLIKRIDRERQHRTLMVKTEEEKMFSVVKKRESFSSISRDSNENEAALKRKNNRKEVSFSIEDEAEHNTTASSGATSFSTFKSQPSEHSQKSGLQDNCLVIGNSLNFNNKLQSSIPVSDDLPPPPPLNQQWHQTKEEEARQLMEILKKADDAASESSGETGTSDSGRGGSDEDVNSHRESGLDPDDSRNFHANSFYPTSFDRFNDGRQSSLSMTSGHGSLQRASPLSNYQGKINTGSIGSGFTRWQDLNNSQGPDDVFEDSYLRRPKYAGEQMSTFNGRMHNQMDYKHHYPRPLEFIRDESFRTGASSVCDDDDRTTTSGSYTINPDELQSEIDGLFFNDVVV
ncbi:protocadherin-11 X-linked isoform X2 [Patella vulgata]|uniref:protocadherin-11 X-linked isoform X2 n=1 Tax=Patella vulgata TaxID=6465 RepID=UPI00217F69F4|nr:protocadherin-11 X-linked isoform X2 [Patella vulgata]